MKNYLATLLLLVCSWSAIGQVPYTSDLYSYQVISDVQYGQVTNFAGNTETLFLDIYKPIGDDNCNRPCLILVHGGAWVQGTKSDAEVVQIAESFAKKGWVVASVSYRLGTHKASGPAYSSWSLCPNPDELKCWHVADTAEVYRANYRAQQDVKGAIRFIKERNAIDSLDVENVFVAGFSAGGFISLAATFLNDPSEKPANCGAIADAPTPHPELTTATCLPTVYSLSRPDLGDVDGDLNLGVHDATVQGVGSFFGGMFNYDMLANTTTWPEIYMFHQANDVIVSVNDTKLLQRLNGCYAAYGNICMPFSHYPLSHGTRSIDVYLNGIGGMNKQTEIVENFQGLPADCNASPAGHSIDYPLVRAQNMADHFATRIAANGNAPSSGPCTLEIVDQGNSVFQIYPNPGSGVVTIESLISRTTQISIYSVDGKLVSTHVLEHHLKIELQRGIYIVCCSSGKDEKAYKKLIIE